MNNDDFDEEYEVEKTKGNTIAITTLSIIGMFVIVIIFIIILTKAFFEDISKKKYYVLEINENNKEQIISLLKQENKKYCDSLYKIEYRQNFPDDKSAKIYCSTEEDIEFSISDDKTSELANYIWENGFIETRTIKNKGDI